MNKKIIQINKISEAKQFFALADLNTLVIFDVDCVLTMPLNPILQLPTFIKYKDIYDELCKDLTKDERHVLNHLLITFGPSTLVEFDTPKIILELQKRNIKTIAMTAGNTDIVIKDKSFSDWRYAELKSLGVDFSKMFLGKEYFDDLKSFKEGKPCIDRGIVYSVGNKNKKGDLLKYLFNILQFTPKKIIAVDDRLKNLDSFTEVTNNMEPKIDFIGLHYHGANFVSTPDVREEDFVDLIVELISKVR